MAEAGAGGLLMINVLRSRLCDLRIVLLQNMNFLGGRNKA
jgi:hypothetical protein